MMQYEVNKLIRKLALAMYKTELGAKENETYTDIELHIKSMKDVLPELAMAMGVKKELLVQIIEQTILTVILENSKD